MHNSNQNLFHWGNDSSLARCPVTDGTFASAWPGHERSSSWWGWGTQTCERGPLLLQIINLQLVPSVSYHTLKCIPDALKNWIFLKIKPLMGKDLNIYQTSGEKRLVKLRCIRKDHKKRDEQNWLQKNLAHLYVKKQKGECMQQKWQAKLPYLYYIRSLHTSRCIERDEKVIQALLDNATRNSNVYLTNEEVYLGIKGRKQSHCQFKKWVTTFLHWFLKYYYYYLVWKIK